MVPSFLIIAFAVAVVYASLHMALVAVQGERLQEIRGVFERSGYTVDGPPLEVNAGGVGGALSKPTSDRNIVRKAVYVAHGWTYIVDPEMVMPFQEQVWPAISSQNDSRIIGWICEGASGTYGLRVFGQDGLERDVLVADGQLVSNLGRPLPAEKGVDWTHAFEDDVLRIAEELGAPFKELTEDVSYHVYTLRE